MDLETTYIWKIHNFKKVNYLTTHPVLMKLKILIILLSIVTLHSCNKIINCAIETTEGTILVELYSKKAPITVSNFMKYVDAGLYTNSSFFSVTTKENETARDIKIEVIQGGDLSEEKDFPAIEIETTDKTGITHVDGTISMARIGPNSAKSSFFICINEQPALNFSGKRNPDGFGFAAFGKVIKRMDVVRKIQSQENKEQLLVKPITIQSIKRIN